MTKEEEIRQLLAQGASKADLVRRGYARGTVYKVGRRLANESTPRSLAADTNGKDSRHASMPSPMKPSADPEISDLQREVQKAKLEVELSRVRDEGVSSEQLRREVRRLEEWVVRTISDLGQCLVKMRGDQVDNAAFERYVRESLAELRGASS